MIGKTLAHYEITDELGKGGMGHVYRARDTKLGRDVALKLLPDDFANDPERLARFRREAKVLASLNHANIAAIHGLEEADGRVFLIMELADGEDLSRRLARGPLTVDEAVNLARQMAEGLEQAHERGVVHRDLKPANVMLTEAGVVKILDFGLARAYAGESPAEGTIESSPTITAAMTQAGTILGTAAYMSPEQARGREVDRRADIWAFGVILFEALTGNRLFEGESISDTLAGVLKTDPDFDELPDETPAAMRWLIERCLQKQPSSRLRDIGEARILLQSDLDQVFASTMGMPAVMEEGRPRWVVPALIGVALVAALAGALGWRSLQGSAPPPPMIHATLLPPPQNSILYRNGGHLALSPDGSRLAFVAVDSLDDGHLWVRRLDSGAAFLMTGTEGATYPFWSPDGKKIGFFIRGSLRKIDAAGGVATTVCPAPSGRGGSWTEDGRILFAPAATAPLSIVSAGGGESRVIAALDSTSVSDRWPHILPDGEHYLYTSLGTPNTVRWASLTDTTGYKPILSGALEGRYFNGYLLFGRDDALWARPFEPKAGEFLGQEALLAEQVRNSNNFGGVAYSATDGGHLVYAVGRVTEQSKVGVYDLEGAQLDLFDFDASYVQDLDLSPDGRYLLVTVYPSEQGEGSDVWMRDLQRGTLSRLTSDEGADDPIWSSTQDEIAYSRSDEVVIRSLVGARPVLRVFEAGSDIIPHDWSDDGRFILTTRAVSASREILVVPVDETEEPWVLVDGTSYNTHPVFSHDGKWVAYMSVTTGAPQIYLREFRPNGSTWQVSSSPSAMPRFGPGDESIYFPRTKDSKIVSVSMTLTSRGPEFGVEKAVADLPLRTGRSNTQNWTLDDERGRIVAFVEPGGQGSQSGAPLDLIVGWPQLLADGD